MSNRETSNNATGASAELNDALAAIIASTKRVARKLNLLEISERIATARKHLGSLDAVASAVGLSSEMLRQFSRVAALSPGVKKLIHNGKLTSVDIADRISRLQSADQEFVANRVTEGDLDSADVRAVLALRKSLPKATIEEVVRRVTRSKNTREFVVQFHIPEGMPQRTVRARLVAFFGSPAIRGFGIKTHKGEVSLDDAGKETLDHAARQMGMSRRAVIDKVLLGEATEK